MKYKDKLRKVSEDTGIPMFVIHKTYMAYWRVVREYVKSQPLKTDLSDEEFTKLRPNVNIPSLGKLNVTLDKYHKIRKIGDIINNNKGK